MIHVDHYGLHRAEGDIALLVQQGRVDHVLGIPMDFKVKVGARRPCTHKIDLNAAQHHPLPDDPLVRAMLPTPKGQNEKPLFLEDTTEHKALVQRLSLLTSPGSYSVLLPFWMGRSSEQFTTLQETNLQPLILHDIRLEHNQALLRLLGAAVYSHRRLIIMGPRHTALGGRAERITPQVTLADLDDINLEAAGAWVLKQHMLGRV